MTNYNITQKLNRAYQTVCPESLCSNLSFNNLFAKCFEGILTKLFGTFGVAYYPVPFKLEPVNRLRFFAVCFVPYKVNKFRPACLVKSAYKVAPLAVRVIV